MKTFIVYQYQNAGGHLEAVKSGWSWPGFLFHWVWAFVKELNMLGVLLLFIYVVVYLLAYVNYTVGILAALLQLGVSIWVGVKGNKQREQKLVNEGHVKVGTIEASSERVAVRKFGADMHAQSVPNL